MRIMPVRIMMQIRGRTMEMKATKGKPTKGKVAKGKYQLESTQPVMLTSSSGATVARGSYQ